MDRNLKIKVDCHAGYSGCGRPKRFEWKSESVIIRKIIKEWREPGAKHYLVEAADGRNFKLAFFETGGHWSALEVVIKSHH